MIEPLGCSLDTITALFISYATVQKMFKKKIKSKAVVSLRLNFLKKYLGMLIAILPVKYIFYHKIKNN